MALYRRSAIKPPEAGQTLSPEGQIRWDLIVAGVGAVVVVIDQITKALIHARFSGSHVYDVVPVIGNVLTLVFDKNPGAAFSSFTNSPLLLGFLILVAVGVIAYMYWVNRSRNYPLLKITFGLILGGAVGNLIDRVRLGYVTDFIHFQLPSLHFDFAIFNIADSAISIGVVMLAIVLWTLPREETPEPGADLPSDAPAAAHPAPTLAAKAPGATAPKTAATAPKSATTAATKPPANGSAKPATTKTPTTPTKAPGSTARAATGATKTVAGASAKPNAKGSAVATAARTGSSKKGKRRS